MNLADFIVLTIVILLLGFTIYKIYRNSKKGGCHSCGEACPSRNNCHK